MSFFVSFFCPCSARTVRPDVSDCRRYREEPTVIGPLTMSRQPSRMSHDIPDGRTKGENRTPGEEMKRRGGRRLNGADGEPGGLVMFPLRTLHPVCFGVVLVPPALGTKDLSRAGVPPPFGGLRETQTNLAAAVVPCWLDSSCCDLNLFCLGYKVPSGQRRHLKGTS